MRRERKNNFFTTVFIVFMSVFIVSCEIPKGTDATLSDISVTTPISINLEPAFSATTLDYTISNLDATSITMIFTKTDTKATITSIKYNGSEQTVSDTVTFTELQSTNTIIVLVTAEDGSSAKTYTIIITTSAPLSYTVSGSITVPDNTYWTKIKVGVLTKGTTAPSKNIQYMAATIQTPITHINNVYYYDSTTTGTPGEFSINKATITGTDDMTRTYSLTLPDFVSQEKYFVVAWYDDDDDDKWDVLNENNYNGITGSEYIRLPVMPL